jgi:hypothetical protein
MPKDKDRLWLKLHAKVHANLEGIIFLYVCYKETCA